MKVMDMLIYIQKELSTSISHKVSKKPTKLSPKPLEMQLKKPSKIWEEIEYENHSHVNCAFAMQYP